MRAFLKAAVRQDFDVAHVHKVNAALRGVFVDHPVDIVGGGAAQGAGAEGQAVGRAVHQFQEPV